MRVKFGAYIDVAHVSEPLVHVKRSSASSSDVANDWPKICCL